MTRARPSETGSRASTEPCGLGPSGFDPARLAGHLHDDVIPALEWILDEERIDYDECPCGDYPLCGAGPCNDFGCVVDKLAEAKALYAIAMEAQRGATGNTDATAEGGDSAGLKGIAQ